MLFRKLWNGDGLGGVLCCMGAALFLLSVRVQRRRNKTFRHCKLAASSRRRLLQCENAAGAHGFNLRAGLVCRNAPVGVDTRLAEAQLG